jgi:predicted RNA-binding Zn-ribbon protein involved in translation (DUF1610 family)
LLETARKHRAAGGGVAREPYVAIFCPHCGEHINEVDEQDTAEEERTPNEGSAYNCGWCGLHTRDWNHVLVCRRTYKARAAFAARQQAAEEAAMFRRSQHRLRKMLDELSE